MPVVPLRLDPATTASSRRAGDLGFDAIRAELDISEFPPEVLAEADAAVRAGPTTAAAADLRHVPFVTIDPPGSMDLDQALSIERAPAGYRLQYAIADVAAFVRPGGALDAEARRRVVTIYLPDRRSPLHPPSLSEGAASLLPDVDRQALVWTIDLDASAAPTSVRVERATVRSSRRFTYAEVQDRLDAGTAEEPLALLAEVGRLREQAEIERGGVSLPLPDQQVVETNGRYELAFRAPLPVEGWNAQISLLTGLSAAALMLDHGVGILRTLPPPTDDTIAVLRQAARALGAEWPAGGSYADLIRSLDPSIASHAALLAQAARLFRGAGYLAFDGETPKGDAAIHAAVAAPYAHVTAPLRRLVDRFGNEIVVAQCAGQTPPGWATEALDELPASMDKGRRRESAANGMALDLVEAVVLAGRSDVLEGIVTSTAKGHASVQLRDPAVVASVDGKGLRPGDTVRLRVVTTDVEARKVTLELVAAR